MPRDSRLYMTFPNDFPWHPKVSRLPADVKWTFVEMNGFSRMNDLDGRIPVVDAEFMWEQRLLDALVSSHPVRPLVLLEGNDYVIRDYAEHQQTKADRERLAAVSRANGSKGGRPRKKPEETQPGYDGNPDEPERKQSQSPEVRVQSSEGLNTVSQSSHSGNRESGDGQTEISRAVISGLGIDPDRLIRHIAEKAGVQPSPAEASALAVTILERGSDVTRPQAYVLGSITKNPGEARDHITASRPAPRAQRDPECDQHPGWPLPCDKCRAIAAEKENA
jgi:hypothetical protein